MAQLPVHPRLACLLLAGKQRGEGTLASDLAALLSERDLLRPMAEGATVATSDSDLLDRLEALNDWRRREGEGTRWPGREPSACRAVERSSRQLRRLLRLTEEEQSRADAGTVASLLLYAYPDRVARQREPGSDGYLLANGRGARLSPWCAVRNRPYLVAVDVDAGAQGEGVIHRASALELAQLRQECPQLIDTRRTVVFDRQRERVTARQEERLGAIVLESRPVDATPDEVAAALQAWLRDEGELTVLPWTAAARQLQSRVRFLARTFPEAGWPELADGALADRLEEWLGPYLGGVRSLADLTRLDLAGILRGLLSREQVRAVDALAPTHLPVPSGSRISLDYPEEGPPVLAVKLQELFGLAETPTVAGGRVMVVLHLLSPARRPIQVTRDLRGFWDGAYREVKRELKGRYPKHPWPDDPWLAVPTAKTVKGSAKR
jgi:ATP-dependent helicase HrpB